MPIAPKGTSLKYLGFANRGTRVSLTLHLLSASRVLRQLPAIRCGSCHLSLVRSFLRQHHEHACQLFRGL